MTTTTENLTAPLTIEQVRTLNELARACANLREYLAEIIQRTQRELERAQKGQHMSGFSGDLFGQSRYQADAAAVKRETLITACFSLGCSVEAITRALLPGKKSYGHENPVMFNEGETFTVDPMLHEGE